MNDFVMYELARQRLVEMRQEAARTRLAALARRPRETVRRHVRPRIPQPRRAEQEAVIPR